MQILRGLHGLPFRIAFSPDGALVAVGATRGAFHIWDTGGGPDPLWWNTNGYLPHNFVFSPDGSSVFGAYWSGRMQHEARTGVATEVRSPTALVQPECSPDGRFVLSVECDRTARTVRFQCVWPIPGGWKVGWHTDRSYHPAYNPNGFRALLFSADGERLVRLYERGRRRLNVSRTGIEVLATATGEVLTEWHGHLPTEASEGSFSPNGVVVLIYQRALYAIDASIPESEPVKRLNSSLKHFTSAAFSRDGSRLATTSNDTAATIWDATTWDVRERYEWNIGRLRAVCFSPDGLRCAAAGDEGQIVVWDLDD